MLAALARALPRSAWASFSVRPATLLRWHRELVRRRWRYSQRRPGRPALDCRVPALVVRLARENPHWGYRRIVGELRSLGISVSASSVRTILGRHGLPPAPRRDELSGRDFLRQHAATTLVFRSEGITVIRTPVQAPNANAHAERWVGSVRRECLDRLLIFSQRQLEYALRVYPRHYNQHRPHRALALRPPEQADGSQTRLRASASAQLNRRDLLGGLIHEYEHAA
jgi:transposase